MGGKSESYPAKVWWMGTQASYKLAIMLSLSHRFKIDEGTISKPAGVKN